ncbi:hypothetical protein CAPTEDRAFT_224553 [Capitella teleta]|uniref:Transcription factor IIIC subunit 5 HTH domain-containing protein n=1 Tax=Capitella teleta TaxID=283909 RepID=R7VI61_CAPTE|nr:hypothetical protein CAPTEDRAFT_224553 [Capitella teleta]|eukprot:ELU15400.1 hypothetical protein CAPTEDRAFT_224553 [Capitella teleta]
MAPKRDHAPPLPRKLHWLPNEHRVQYKTLEVHTNRLELNWRPKDIYSKPTYGDQATTTRLLLRVKKKKKNVASSDGVLEGEILGTIPKSIIFKSMGDFQFLPMRGKEGKYENMMDEIILGKIENSSWIHKSADVHILPTFFSRVDSPSEYCFRDDRNNPKLTASKPHYIGAERKRRTHHTIALEFAAKTIPMEPLLAAKIEASKGVKNSDLGVKLAQLFKDRPIWSKNAIMHELKVSPHHLKLLLPTVAYYWLTGPWRTMWTAFGFDPRTDSSSKLLQTIDYRLRTGAHVSKAVLTKIPSKRSTLLYTIPTSKCHPGKLQPPRIDQALITSKEDVEDDETGYLDSSSFIFNPNVLPMYRQTFYQVMNVEMPEVQALVHANDGEETECSERDGWLLPDTLDKCRDLMSEAVRSKIAKQKGMGFQPNLAEGGKGKASVKYPAKNSGATSVEDDEMKSDDEELLANDDNNEASEEQNEMEQELLEFASNLSAMDGT